MGVYTAINRYSVLSNIFLSVSLIGISLPTFLIGILLIFLIFSMLAAERDRIRAEGRTTEGLDWRGALESGMLDEIRAGRIHAAKELLKTCLSSSSA